MTRTKSVRLDCEALRALNELDAALVEAVSRLRVARVFSARELGAMSFNPLDVH